jgi:hypothetical protein
MAWSRYGPAVAARVSLHCQAGTYNGYVRGALLTPAGLRQAWDRESNEEAARQHVESIAGLLGELAAVQRTADRINGLEQLLGWDVSDFAPVQQV